jgi:hypothetical protein
VIVLFEKSTSAWTGDANEKSDTSNNIKNLRI